MELFVSDLQLQKTVSDNKDLGLIQWMSVLYVRHLTNKGSDEQLNPKPCTIWILKRIIIIIIIIIKIDCHWFF